MQGSRGPQGFWRGGIVSLLTTWRARWRLRHGIFSRGRGGRRYVPRYL